jgi:putative FmdB family regulatory protein
MFFPFQCQKCKKKFDVEKPIGQAPREASCPACKGTAKRIYEGMSIAVKIDGATHRTSNFGEQMKQRNAAAGYRMQGKKAPVRLTAYDHGNGDVREVKVK